MKIKRLIKNIVLAAALLLPVSSCSDWLEVEMEDGILEDALYADNEGFLTVLNGVYSNLNTSYASFLSMGAVDVMAQYYNVQRNASHPYYIYANYQYDDEDFDAASGSVWSHLYSLILNTNVLLEQCDKEGSALSKQYYNIVKGEALALRAMMHFDLLRLYGPIYTTETASQQAIAYLKDTERKMQDILPASKVVELILDDLKNAATLLADDLIRTDGVNSSESEDLQETNDFRYRQYRLNYYAVQGLLARLYMWTGDKVNARNTVSALITEIEENETFPWVTKSTVDGSNGVSDRVFSTEVIFGLYNVNRLSLFNGVYNKTLEGNALSFIGGVSGENSKLATFYGTSSGSDYRAQMWESVVQENLSQKEENKVGNSYLLKYSDIETTEHYRYMIPLMRISEMYLIAAECSDNLEDACSYINTIRLNRSVADIENVTTENIQEYITAEFAREVIGEGQLFFYYKRHAMETFASGTSANTTFSMDLSSYVVPLPTIESNNRQ